MSRYLAACGRRFVRTRRLVYEPLEDRRVLAAIITVNSVQDNDLRDDELTLREAILINNQALGVSALTVSEQAHIVGTPDSADADTIAFNIPGSGVHSIGLATQLPSLTEGAIIDGYTQPGASPNTNAIDDPDPAKRGFNGTLLIELSGGGSVLEGLNLADGSTVRGLVINRFSHNGINAGSGCVIEGNFIGTDPTGTLDRGNTGAGIIASGSNNRIGGTLATSRNVVSNNFYWGIGLQGVGDGTGNVVQGNFVGTDASGTRALGNKQLGIFVSQTSSNTIGGLQAGSRNVVSSNGSFAGGSGIYIQSSNFNTVQANFVGLDVTGTQPLGNASFGIVLQTSRNNLIGGTIPAARNVVADSKLGGGIGLTFASQNTIQGNFIGTDASGTRALGNAGDGVGLFRVTSSNLVGGALAGAANLIAFNRGSGVHLDPDSRTGNAVLANSIFSNSGLGIDLGSDGITPNDIGDTDFGPNDLQNFPELTSVISAAGTTTIHGALNSLANKTFRIEFFVSAEPNPSQFGEGQSFITSTLVTTNGSGDASFSVQIPTPSGTFFAATATLTDGEGGFIDTSEFSAGTVAAQLVIDINPGPGDGMLAGIPIAGVGGTAFFPANDGISGVELWKSDGTVVGTTLVKDIQQGTFGSTPGSLGAIANVNGTLFFSADDGLSGFELWKSDGTIAGTVLVKDINVGGGIPGSYPINFANVNGILYFTAIDNGDGQSRGFELWKSDGTDEGTVLVKEIVPGVGSPFPSNLTNVDGTLFFTANDGISGTELWKSDGTEAGTLLVADIVPGPGGSAPTSLSNLNGTLFFAANDGASGTELWRSDGTAAGTMIVADILPGPESSSPSSLANVNGTLFFAAANSEVGRELWKSNGTVDSAMLVSDINPGAASSNPDHLTNLDSGLYFAATAAHVGTELWTSDGTADGTKLVADIISGPDSSAPRSLANVDGALFFSAIDGVHGRELWKLVPANEPPVANSDVFAAVEDTPLVIAGPGVLSNDTDSNNDDLSVIVVDHPRRGSLSLNSDGSFSYTPNPNVFGTDSFTYNANDGRADSNIATVTINVAPVNDPPSGVNRTVTTREDTTFTFTSAIFGFSDALDLPRNTFLAVRITTLPAEGTLTVNGVPAIAGEVVPVSQIWSMRYTPAPNENGIAYASFTFQVQDNGGTANGGVDLDPSPNTVTINVTSVNDAPSGTNGTVTTAEDAAYVFNVADFGLSDPNDMPPNNLLLVRLVTVPAAGSLTLNGVRAFSGLFAPISTLVNGQMRFTPAPNANGVLYASFTFQVQDNGGTANGGVNLDPSSNTLTINVTPVNDAPVADDDSHSTSQGTPLTVSAPGVLENDSDLDGDSLSVALATAPSNGTVTVNADGSFTYTPVSTFSGIDSFSYTVSDGNGGTDTAAVSIDVAPAAPGSILSIVDTCLGGDALLVTGTSADDTIVVGPGSSPTTLTVTINEVASIVPKPSGRIIVTGGEGNDKLQVVIAVENPAWLYGDDGNDRLFAGSGGGLLIGGDGDDNLTGSSGREVLVGGHGADNLLGSSSDDILVASSTTKDGRAISGHEDFWCNVLAEWNSTNSFAVRVQNLRDGAGGSAQNNGSYLLPNVVDSVFADDQPDILNGGAGDDWLIFMADEDNSVGSEDASN